MAQHHAALDTYPAGLATGIRSRYLITPKTDLRTQQTNPARRAGTKQLTLISRPNRGQATRTR